MKKLLLIIFCFVSFNNAFPNDCLSELINFMDEHDFVYKKGWVIRNSKSEILIHTWYTHIKTDDTDYFTIGKTPFGNSIQVGECINDGKTYNIYKRTIKGDQK